MHRRVVLSLLGAILVACSRLRGLSPARSAGTINIGWSGDKSGPTVASQGPALDGLRAYFKMVNDAGGVKGNKINLIEQDDALQRREGARRSSSASSTTTRSCS